MKLARVVTTALLMGLSVTACKKDKKSSTGLTAAQRTELGQKIEIAAEVAGFDFIPGIGTLFAVSNLSGVTVNTNLTATLNRAIVEGVNAAVRQYPSLQTSSSQSYMGMGLMIHLTNTTSTEPDLFGVIAINGFPINAMIVALSDQNSASIGNDALGALITFAGTCTLTSNCTIGQFFGTNGSFSVSPSGSTGGSCAGFPAFSGVSCNYLGFNGSFNIQATDPGQTTTRSATMGTSALAGIKITYDCNQDPAGIC